MSSMKDKAKAAAAAGGLIAAVGSAGSGPIENRANVAHNNSQAKAQMRDRANEQASRLRGETAAKGQRDRGTGGKK